MGRVNIVLHTPFCEGAGQIIYVCVVSYIKSLDVGRIPPYPHGGEERISPIDMSFEGGRGGGGGTGGLKFRGAGLWYGRWKNM